MITEDYVSFETAKLLKEKGFDESCYQKYDNEGYLSFNHVGYINDEKPCADFCALAPTHQMAMKWLREIYGIDIVIEISDPAVKDRKYYCVIWDKNNDSYILDLFNSYEEACEAAIKYSLENLI